MSLFDQRMAAIVAALDAFEGLLTPDRPVDLAAFIRGRLQLSRAANEFLANEWGNLSQNLGHDADRSRSEIDEIHKAFVSLRADYSRHISSWDSGSLVKDWSGYRRSCQQLIRSMRTLLRIRSVASAMKAA